MAGSQPPLIIIGMHRSGTSMVTRVLRELGVFTGRNVDPNDEAFFFQRINRWLFQLSGATWDRPGPARQLAAESKTRQPINGQLERLLRSPRVAAYSGWLNWLRYRAPGRFPFPWCWKDPRNTFTLPFWTDLFPGARVIHVVRNGVDVAASLAHRGVRELAALGERFSWVDFIANRPLPDTALSVLCLELEEGFRLWEAYCAEAEEQLSRLPAERTMTIGYETLLEEPLPLLRDLCAFAGVSPEATRLAAVAADLDAGRRNAWAQDQQLRDFHQSVSGSETMKRYGY
jgi:hypothetical protein